MLVIQDKLLVYFYRSGVNCIWPFSLDMGLPFYSVSGSNPEELNSDYFVETDDPAQADFFIFPYDLGSAINFIGITNITVILRKLKYFAAYEDRHVFVLGHDESRPFGINSIFFRNGASLSHSDPHTFAIPYPCDDFSHMLDADFAKLPYDTSFVGFKGHVKLRSVMTESVLKYSNLHSYIRLREAFFTHHRPEVNERNRSEFLDSLALSRTVLCPRGEGVGSVRFSEAMSAGRVPVMLADDYALPFSESIAYDDLMLKIPQSQVAHTGQILTEWLTEHPPELLQEMGLAGRKAWEGYLCPAIWLKRVCRKLCLIKEEWKERGGDADISQVPEMSRDSGWLAEPLHFVVCEEVSHLNGVEGELNPAELHNLFVKAAELPRCSVAVYLAPEDSLKLMSVAGGLAYSGNYDSSVYAVAECLSGEMVFAGKQAGLNAWINHLAISPLGSVEKFSLREVDLLLIDLNFPSIYLESAIRDWVPKIRFGGVIIVYLPAEWQQFSSPFISFLDRSGFSFKLVRQSAVGCVVEIQFKVQAEFRQRLNIDGKLLEKIPLFNRLPIIIEIDNDSDSLLPSAVSDGFSLGGEWVLLVDSASSLSDADVETLLQIAKKKTLLAAVVPVPEKAEFETGDLIYVDDPGRFPVVLNCQAVKVVGGLKPELKQERAFADLYRRLRAKGFRLAVTTDVAVRQSESVFAHLGTQLLLQQRYVEAIKILVAWLKLADLDKQAEIYTLLAVAYQKNGKNAEAQVCRDLANR